MRIAHIESSMHWGGQELRIVEQTQWLNDHGHPTWIIARPGSAIVEKALEKSLPVYQMPIRGSFNVSTLRQTLRFVDFHGIELLDCHGNRDAAYGAYVRWLTGLPVIRSRHVIDPVRNSRLNRLIWNRGNDGVIVTAETIRQQLVAGGLHRAERVFVAAAGVDEQRFHPRIDATALRRELGIPQHHFVVANIGMIRSDKGQLQFVEACRELLSRHADMTCIQIGAAPSHSVAYEQKVRQAAGDDLERGRIRFLGYRDDIENGLALADAVVIASIATEAKTRLVAQAFLMKKNIVATDTGGLREMIEHEQTGLICPAKNPAALAAAVERLIDEPALAERLRENAYAHARQHLTFEHMMNGMLDTYRQALARL